MFLRQGFQRRVRARSMTAVLAVAVLAGGAGAAHAVVPPKDPPVQVGTLIRINRGIGDLTIGLMPADVRRLLGTPSHVFRITDTAGQRRVLRMDYRRYGLSMLFERNAPEPNALVVIDIGSARYHTTGGIHVRSSKRALLRAHHQVRCGPLSGGQPGEEVCSIQGDGRRTVFVTTRSRRIRSIQIGTD
jgi:hypothetical protein